jgi:disulfide bond formation protein DsbB
VWHEIKLLRFISMLSIGSFTFALISQYVFDMQPCAWCVFQRLLYLIIGVGALLLTLRPRNRVYLSLGAAGIVATGIAGLISAVYQEKVAANTFSCAQTFADQLMTKSGLDAAVPWLFGIYASCMEARVKLMGIEYAWWSMLMFSLLSVLGLITLLKLRRQ